MALSQHCLVTRGMVNAAALHEVYMLLLQNNQFFTRYTCEQTCSYGVAFWGNVPQNFIAPNNIFVKTDNKKILPVKNAFFPQTLNRGYGPSYQDKW